MKEISDIVTSTVSKYPCIIRIGIFGSYARGDFDTTSDIDILYDYNSDMDDFDEQVLDFVGDILERIKPMKADFVCFENIVKREDDFKRNVLDDVRWLYRAENREARST